MPMKMRTILVAAAVAAVVGQSDAFTWEPVSLFPMSSSDVTTTYSVQNVSFQCYDVEGVKITDVMPSWIDEDGNEIKAVSGQQDPSGWNPNEFAYHFNISDFKSNGEYILHFPEGMLMNAAGEKSDKVDTAYSFVVPEFASAMFDDFKVVSVSPDFSEPQAIWNKQVVTISTNHNDAIGFTKLLVTDQTTGESITISTNYTEFRPLGDSSEISWTVEGEFKFFEGHNYTAEFIFYNGSDEYTSEGSTPIVGRQTYEFTGKVEGYRYSDLTLLSISPAPYTMTISEPSQAVFTYTFSGPVNVYKVETPMGQFGTNVYPQTCLSSNEDKTVWTLDLSDDDYIKTVDAELVIYLYARDLDGSQLKGDFGEEGSACYTAGWMCDLGAKGIAVVSPQNGQTLDSLNEVVIKSEDGEVMTYNYGEMAIQNLLGETLGTLIYEGDGGSEAEFHFTKWQNAATGVEEPLNIVAEGSYVIYISTGAFVFGEQFSSKNSRSLYSGFQITGNLDEKPDDPTIDPAEQETLTYTEVSPADGATVESLEEIILTFPEEISFNGCDVKIYDADQNLVATKTADYDWESGMFNVVYVKLNDPIVTPGAYEVVIPARTLQNNEFSMSDGKAGLCNPEIRLHYTVGSEADDPQAKYQFINANPEVGSTVEALDLILLTFPGPAIFDDFEVKVYSAARNVVATGLGTYDMGDPTRVVIRFSEPITEPGIYDVVVPAGVIGNPDFYMSEGAEGLCNPEFHLYYTVGEGQEDPGVDPTEQEVFNYTEVSPADGSTVSELNHISLLFPDEVMTVNDVAYVYKAGESDPVTKCGVSWDMDDVLLINVNLYTPILDAGEYVVVIPARTIADNAFFGSDGKSGICNPEIRLTYTVDPAGSGVASVVEISNCDVYDLQGRVVLHNASNDDLKNLSKGIYVVNGKKIVVK